MIDHLGKWYQADEMGSSDNQRLSKEVLKKVPSFRQIGTRLIKNQENETIAYSFSALHMEEI
jgi:hypothetical protein